MSRKVQTIYEYFKEYSEEMIDKVISDLNPEDKKIINYKVWRRFT